MDKLDEKIKHDRYEYAIIKALLGNDNTIYGFDLVESSIGFNEACRSFFQIWILTQTIQII